MADREETQVLFNIFSLKNRLEAQKGKGITWNQVAQASGIHVHTLTQMAENKAKRVDRDTLTRLLRWFREQGLDVDPGDMWTEGPIATD